MMDLSCVRHGRLAPRQVAMTDERPGMSIALDADVIEENQAFASRLAEAMLVVAGEACNPCCQGRRGLEIGSIDVHTLGQPVRHPVVPRANDDWRRCCGSEGNPDLCST